MTVSIKVSGVNRVRNALRRVASFHPDETDKVMEPWAKAAARALKRKPYPPKRPRQKYKRTGKLGSSWRARRQRGGIWSVSNSRDYAGYVVGERQAWMHVRRWWRARPVLEESTPNLVKALSEQMENIWDG